MDKTIIFGLLLFLVIGCTNNVAGDAQYVPQDTEVYVQCGDNKCEAGEKITCLEDCTEPVTIQKNEVVKEEIKESEDLTVYVATEDGVVAILNGEKIWNTPLAVSSNIVSSNSQVFVGTTEIVSLSAPTGLIKWSYDTKKCDRVNYER